MTKSIRGIFVDDEADLFEDYSENLKLALRDRCDTVVEFEHVGSVERAKELLAAGQTAFRLVVTDMLFPRVGGGGLSDRGREVIESAARTPTAVVVAISQGDTKNFPNLREDALDAGADMFRYKQQIVSYSAGERRSGWDDLAQEICEALARPRPGRTPKSREPIAAERRSVFLVYGRDSRLVSDFLDFLRALNLAPIEWDDLVSQTINARQEGGNPSIISIIQTGFDRAAGCVVLLTPDDEARLRSDLIRDEDPPWEADLVGQPRPNVLLEAGYALGWDIGRTLLVSAGHLRPVSDLSGMHVARLDNSPESRKAIAQRLRDIRLDVRTEGTHWLRVGDFDAKS
jgi:predicted nucleotide-binding protein